jgi:hypothetical protein
VWTTSDVGRLRMLAVKNCGFLFGSKERKGENNKFEIEGSGIHMGQDDGV